MPRLITALLLVSACSGAPAEPAPSRVNAVAKTSVDARAIDSFCEVHTKAEQARPFQYPSLDAPPPPSTGWRWVSLWATWCGPCIAEMPMLAKWKDKLAGMGKQVDLQLISVDDSVEIIERFQAKHPELSVGKLRATSPSAMGPWLPQVGLDQGAPIPIHVFIDPEGRTRCVRTGAIDPGDFDTVRAILDGA